MNDNRMKLKNLSLYAIVAVILAILLAPVSCNLLNPVDDPTEQDDPASDDPGNSSDDPSNPDKPGEDGYIHAGPKYGDWFIKIYHPWVEYHDYMRVSSDGHYMQLTSEPLTVETNMSEWKMEPDTISWLSFQLSESSIYVSFTPNDTPDDRIANVVVHGIEGNVMCTDTLKIFQYGGSAITEPIDGIAFDVMPQTLVIDQKSSSYFTGCDEENGYYYYADDTPSSILSSNKSIILNPYVSEACPNGLCGKFVPWTDPDGRRCFKVQPVALEKAIKNLNMVDVPVDLNSHVVEIKDPSGKSLKFQRTKASGSDHLKISIPKTTFHNLDQSILVTAAVEMDLSMKMNLQIADGSLDYFSMILDPDITLDVEMEANVAQPVVDKSYPFYTVLCGAFTVGPVVLTPLLEFSFVIGAEGKIGIKAGVKYENNSGIMFVYQTGQGCDYKIRDQSPSDQKNLTQFSGSMYMEGSMNCGLDQSIGLGVYGTILYVTLGIQEKLKCTANMSVDLDKMVQDPDFLYNSTIMFTTDATLQGVVALKSLGATLADAKTMEKPYRLDSLFLFPKMCPVVDEISRNQAYLQLEVGNDLILPLGVGLNVYCVEPSDPLYKEGEMAQWKIDDSYRVGSYTLADHHRIDPNNSRMGQDELGPVNVYNTVIPTPVQSGMYIVRPFVSYNYVNLEDKSYKHTVMFYAESGCEEAFRKILLDIAKSIDPKDRLLNWCADEPVSSWKGVTISYDEKKTPTMTVDLKGTNAKGVVTVGNHTEGLDCLWELMNYSAYGQPRAPITGLDISDPHFDGWDWNIRYILQTLRLNVNRKSEKLQKLLNAAPQNVVSTDQFPLLKTIELYGENPWACAFRTSSTNSANYRDPMFPALEKFSCTGKSGVKEIKLYEVPTLVDFTMDPSEQLEELVYKGPADLFEKYNVRQFKNIKTVKITNETPDASYSFRDLPKITRLDVMGKSKSQITIERCFPQDFVLDIFSAETYFTNENIIGDTKTMTLKDCGFRTLHINFNNMDSMTHPAETLFVQDCKYCSFFSGGSTDLHLVNLPLLKSFDIRNCGLKSFEFVDLPALLYIDMKDNHDLPRQTVPALFDEVRMRRYRNPEAIDHSLYYNLGYDVTYRYWSKYDYDEVDWGFYYPDEPDCGYHWIPPRNGLPWDDKNLRWP